MLKINRYSIILISLMILSCLNTQKVMGEDYTKNVEVGEMSIKLDRNEFPPLAYLYIELKNTGDKKISNLNLEISYYGSDSYLIKRAVVKNALTEAIPKQESRKYKICLKGDVINPAHEQYPYSVRDKVSEFDVKVINVNFASK